jgi:hypothetical protein
MKKRYKSEKRGKIIYAPKSLIDLANEVKKENNMHNNESLLKISHDARNWIELEKNFKRLKFL